MLVVNFLYIFISSAKTKNFSLVIHLLIEFTNNMESSGLRWPPSGTSIKAETELDILMSCFLPDKYELNQERSGSPILSNILFNRLQT